ncbi:winged helix-turn-helix transcriptional regulator [Catellatospora tritici]|uniref:winged helix-turn-helix transcriptional regulator n=1 Tax=Catellatospora tritici TaxID=2851566 RepID=UPI001C2D8D2F|nr:helix-turn-helix domain-containing protein [Catellatospora tritici]MBV1852894.1 helix-turn-helix transcriptional regulator [Catellatospora tritici]
MEEPRSGCPINLAVEVLGDRWSLVIIRDMMFGNRRHFRDLLHHNQEGIASNILAARLQRLTDLGLVTRGPDPGHKQKVVYSLTEPAIQLVPIIAELGAWGLRHLPASRPLAVRARLLACGGRELWDEFMDELREQHLGSARPPGAEPVVARLRAAYEAELAAERAAS